MTTKLDGRVGVITGAASGIGRAGALLFAKEGAALVLVDVNPEGDDVVSEIRSAGGSASFIQGDAADGSVVRGAVDRAVRDSGKLDLLWSNVGMPVFKTALDTTEAEWDRIVDVNLKSGFLLAKYGIPHVIAAGRGTMVFTGSTASVVGSRRWAAYCATKGGVLMLCRAMALDYAEYNVRINCVCHGATDTPMEEADMRSRDEPYDQVVRDEKAAHPMNRYATPLEVANAALFLSCDESSFTTGSALFVDGGLSAQ